MLFLCASQQVRRSNPHLIVEKFIAEEGEDVRLLGGVETEERLLPHPLRHLVGSILLHQPASHTVVNISA